MDVMNAEQAKIAEEAGACAVMALGEFSISQSCFMSGAWPVRRKIDEGRRAM